MRIIGISAFLVALAVITAGCEKIPFDQDHSKIISFADPNFRERITPYFDANGDGYISIQEAENGRTIYYEGINGSRAVVMDCDNGNKDYPSISGIDEVRFFTNVQVLLFGSNDLSGTLDLTLLESLRIADFTDNDIDEVMFPENAEVLLLRDNNFTGTLDLELLESLKKADFTNNDIDEVIFPANAEVLLFRSNNLSGTIDLTLLRSLKEIDFTDNPGLRKIILHSSVEQNIDIKKDPKTEIEYYTEPEE